MPDALTTLREAVNRPRPEQRLVNYDHHEALDAVEALVQAVEAAVNAGDYWDWVTGYAPELRSALARVKGES